MSPALFIEPRTSGDGGTTAALGAFNLRVAELLVRSGGGATTETSGRGEGRVSARLTLGGGGNTAVPRSNFCGGLIADNGIAGGGVVNACIFCPSAARATSSSRSRPVLMTSWGADVCCGIGCAARGLLSCAGKD